MLMIFRRLWHALFGHPVDDVDVEPLTGSAVCSGCGSWLPQP